MVIRKKQIISIVLLTFVVIFIKSLLFKPSLYIPPNPYPSIQEAFESRSKRDMGDILFIDDNKDSVTVLHSTRKDTHTELEISHFRKESTENGVMFSFVLQDIVHEYDFGVEAGNTLPYQRRISFFIQRVDSNINTWTESNMINIGRIPLNGISRHSEIHNLIVNDQRPDYIVEFTKNSGFSSETLMYFWYYSDFQYTPGDDIVVEFIAEE